MLTNASHGLHMPVPLKIERGDAQANGLAYPLLRLIITSELAQRFDLAAAVAFVLLGVDGVGLRGAWREAVEARQLAIDSSGAAIGPARSKCRRVCRCRSAL